MISFGPRPSSAHQTLTASRTLILTRRAMLVAMPCYGRKWIVSWHLAKSDHPYTIHIPSIRFPLVIVIYLSFAIARPAQKCSFPENLRFRVPHMAFWMLEKLRSSWNSLAQFLMPLCWSWRVWKFGAIHVLFMVEFTWLNHSGFSVFNDVSWCVSWCVSVKHLETPWWRLLLGFAVGLGLASVLGMLGGVCGLPAWPRANAAHCTSQNMLRNMLRNLVICRAFCFKHVKFHYWIHQYTKSWAPICIHLPLNPCWTPVAIRNQCILQHQEVSSSAGSAAAQSLNLTYRSCCDPCVRFACRLCMALCSFVWLSCCRVLQRAWSRDRYLLASWFKSIHWVQPICSSSCSSSPTFATLLASSWEQRWLSVASHVSVGFWVCTSSKMCIKMRIGVRYRFCISGNWVLSAWRCWWCIDGFVRGSAGT